MTSAGYSTLKLCTNLALYSTASVTLPIRFTHRHKGHLISHSALEVSFDRIVKTNLCECVHTELGSKQSHGQYRSCAYDLSFGEVYRSVWGLI